MTVNKNHRLAVVRKGDKKRKSTLKKTLFLYKVKTSLLKIQIKEEK